MRAALGVLLLLAAASAQTLCAELLAAAAEMDTGAAGARRLCGNESHCAAAYRLDHRSGYQNQSRFDYMYLRSGPRTLPRLLEEVCAGGGGEDDARQRLLAMLWAQEMALAELQGQGLLCAADQAPVFHSGHHGKVRCECRPGYRCDGAAHGPGELTSLLLVSLCVLMLVLMVMHGGQYRALQASAAAAVWRRGK